MDQQPYPAVAAVSDTLPVEAKRASMKLTEDLKMLAI